MLIPYPNDFPSFALSVIMDRLRGKSVEWTVAVHAAWVVIGYALGNMLPNQPNVIGAKIGDPDSEADLIEKVLVEHQQKAVTGIIPYAILAEIAVNLLFKLFIGRKF